MSWPASRSGAVVVRSTAYAGGYSRIASISAARVTTQALHVAGQPGAGPRPRAPRRAPRPPRPAPAGWHPSRCRVTSARPRSSRGRPSRNTRAWSRTSCGVSRRHRPGRSRRAAARRGRPAVTDPGAPEPGEHVLHHLLEPAVQPAGAAVAQGGPPHRQLHHLQAAPPDRVAHLRHQRVEHRDEPLHVVPEQGAPHHPQRVAHGQQVQVDHGAVRAHPVRGRARSPRARPSAARRASCAINGAYRPTCRAVNSGWTIRRCRR